MKIPASHLALLCFTLGVAQCNGKPRAEKAAHKTLTGMGKMQTDVFGMDSRDYFTDPGKTFSDVGYRMADSGQQGLLLGGPDYVAYEKDARFPVSCLNVAEALELRDYGFRSYSLIAAVDLVTGAFYADHLIEQRFKKVERDPNASPPPPGISFEGSAGDLFARLEIPRRSAEYLITGLLLDRASNRVKIRVGSEAARADDVRFAAEVVDASKAPPPQHSQLRTRSLVQEPGSPLLPVAPGIHAAVLPPRKPFTQQEALDLRVAYTLPHPRIQPGGKPASEIVFHILCTGTRVATPVIKRVVVPILPANRTPDGALQGFFSLDVNQGHNLEGNQAYSIYLFSGEHLGALPKVDVP